MIITSVEQQDGESQKEYTQRLRDLLIEERAFPKSSDPFGPIDYVGSILSDFAAHRAGVPALPWGSLPEDQKKQFREMAVQTVSSWAVEQIMVAKSR